MSQEIHKPTSTADYVAIWGALIASLILLLAIRFSLPAALAVPLTFLVAAANAYLMFSFFMHGRLEHSFARWVMIGAVLAILVLLVALVPDIVLGGVHMAVS